MNEHKDRRYEEIRQDLIRAISIRYGIPYEEIFEDSINELLLLRKRLYVSIYMPFIDIKKYRNTYNAEDMECITENEEISEGGEM